MVTIRAFPGIRPLDPESFCVKPNDIIEDDELTELRKGNNAIHIILPEGEGKALYQNAEKAFHKFLATSAHDKPSMYLYQESNMDISQRGFIFTVSLADYAKGSIKKHEETREKPLRNRIKHMEATKANTGLVWTVFNSLPDVKESMDQIMTEKPVEDFKKYGYRHRLWKVTDDVTIEHIVHLFKDLVLYIADGHHRIGAAYEYSLHHPEAEAQYAMVFAACDDEVRILPYNRVITTIYRPDFIEAIMQYFEMSKLIQPALPDKHEIQMYFEGDWWRLIPKAIPDDLVASLDVSILQNQLLAPILGITDIRNDSNIFFVGGYISRTELERLVDEGTNDAVFYLHPTSIQELKLVSDEQRSMPPKSTWFDPKLLTGLVFHLLY